MVKFQLQEGTAKLADFNAGSFNEVTATILAGKTTATTSYTAITNDGTELSETYSVQATVAGVTTPLTQQVTILDGSVGAGQSFVLTKDQDIIPGMTGSNGNAVNSGNDTINGLIDLTNTNPAAQGTSTTFNGFDSINGGDGTNTFKLAVSGGGATVATDYDVALNNVEKVQIVEINSTANLGAKALLVDATSNADITDLKVTKSSSDITLTGTGAQNISVAGTAGVAIIEGGKNVTVTDATADKNITIGGTEVNAGTITVTDTKLGTGVLTIDGGTDVTVTASGVTGTGTIDIGQGGATTDLASGAVTVTSTGAAYDPAALGDAQSLSAINVTGGKTISVTQVATSDASKAASDETTVTTITQGDVTIVAADTTTAVTVKQDAAKTGTPAKDSTGGVTETVSVKFVNLAATKTVIINGLTLTAVTDMLAADVAKAFANLAANAAIPSDATPTKAKGDTQSSAADAKATYSGSIDGWSSGAATGDTVVFTYGTANAAPGGAALAVTGTGTAITPTVITTGKAHDATPVGGVATIVAGTVDITADAAVTTVTVDGYSGAGSKIQDATTNTALATITLANGGDMTIDSAATTLALNLTNVSGTVDVVAGTTTLNATVTGTTTATLASASATSVKVSGTGIVAGTTATGLTAATAIDTTGMTAGTATFTLDTTATTYTGGAGADKVTTSNTTAATKAIDLGTGNDKLTFVTGSTNVSTVTLKGGTGDDTVSLVAANAVTLGGSTAFAAKLDSFERLELTGATGAQDVNVANLGFANYVTVTGVAAGGALTLTNLATSGTLVLTGDAPSVIAVVKDADTNLTDVLNVVMSKATVLAITKLTAADVEAIKLTVTDTDTSTINTHTLDLKATKATSLTIDGNAGLTLTLDAATTKLATIDANAMTAALTVTAMDTALEMTITGGSGNDVLQASGVSKSVIYGGIGNDTIVAGTVSSDLYGGDGNDLFIMKDLAGDGVGGNKDADSYSIIRDFAAGDLLQMVWTDNANGDAQKMATAFDKLVTTLQDETASLLSFANAAAEQAAVGEAVWFNYKGNAYVLVDSDTNSTGSGFVPTEDLIIRLQGVLGENLSFNDTFGTVALI